MEWVGFIPLLWVGISCLDERDEFVSIFCLVERVEKDKMDAILTDRKSVV